MNMNELSDRQLQLIYAGVLGNLSFHTPRSINFQLKDKDFIEYKYNILSNICYSPPKVKHNTNGYQYYGFMTKQLDDIGKIYAQTKEGFASWIDIIDDYGLTLYWLDSGSIYTINGYKYIKLKAPIQHKEALVVQKWLKDKFNITCVMHKNGIRSKTYYIKKEYVETLKNIITPYKEEFKGAMLNKFNF